MKDQARLTRRFTDIPTPNRDAVKDAIDNLERILKKYEFLDTQEKSTFDVKNYIDH